MGCGAAGRTDGFSVFPSPIYRFTEDRLTLRQVWAKAGPPHYDGREYTVCIGVA